MFMQDFGLTVFISLKHLYIFSSYLGMFKLYEFEKENMEVKVIFSVKA